VVARTILFCCVHLGGSSHLFFKPEAHGITGPGAAISHGIDYIKTRPVFGKMFAEKFEVHRKERLPKPWVKHFKEAVEGVEAGSGESRLIPPKAKKDAKAGLSWMLEALEQGGTRGREAAEAFRERVAKELHLSRAGVSAESGFAYRIGSEVYVNEENGVEVARALLLLGYEQTLLEEHQKRTEMIQGEQEEGEESAEETRRKRDRALRPPLQYLAVMCMQSWAMTFCNKLQLFLTKHFSDPSSPNWLGDTAELFALGVEATQAPLTTLTTHPATFTYHPFD